MLLVFEACPRRDVIRGGRVLPSAASAIADHWRSRCRLSSGRRIRLEREKRGINAPFRLTERPRSRTEQAWGCHTGPVLKTGWATGPVPLQKRDRRGAASGARHSSRPPAHRDLVSPPVALTVDVVARVLAQIRRAEDEHLEARRSGLVAAPGPRRDAHGVPLLDLHDLVVELHP